MDFETKKLADGRVQLTITMEQSELDDEVRILELADSGAEDSDDDEDTMETAGWNPFGRKKRYCCTCPGSGPGDTTRHTIRARNSVSAGLKCLRECGGGFGLRKGAC
jgi:hypothetical protein